MTIIKYLQLDQISASNNPLGVDIPLNKKTQTIRLCWFFCLIIMSSTLVCSTLHLNPWERHKSFSFPPAIGK